jgi:putative inorganic carbon (hco3(-)) transporter
VAFAIFLLINAILFLRPAELLPIEGLPLYEIAMIACLLFTNLTVANQLSPSRLVEDPITVCLIGLIIAIVLSLLSHAGIAPALVAGYEFLKVVVYYLMLIAVIDNVSRLENFLTSVLWMLVAVAIFPLLQIMGLTHFAIASSQEEFTFDAFGQVKLVHRLQSVGLDPNDLAMLTATGLLLCLWRISLAETVIRRCFWLLPIGLLFYVLLQTQSRGGLLCLIGGGLVLMHTYFGIRKTSLVALAAGVAVVLGLGGRMTDVSALASGTGQSRLQMWSAGLAMLRQEPIFGVGYGTYQDYAGEVAHNSFVHCFAELGLFGGTLFLGAFAAAAWMLANACSVASIEDENEELNEDDTRLCHLRPFLLAVVVAYVVGMFSLSRSYVVPTYMILGLSTAWLRLAGSRFEFFQFSFDRYFLRRLAAVDTVFLLGIYGFVQLFIRWY